MAKLWGDEDPQQNISQGKKVGIPRKKTYGYQERDEEKRVGFRGKLERIANNRKFMQMKRDLTIEKITPMFRV